MSLKCSNCGRELTPQQSGEPCPTCGSRDRTIRAEDQAVLVEKAEVSKVLARKHFEIEPGLTRVSRFSGSLDVEALPTEPIKLLEVNRNTVASGVLPLRFGPALASGITFASTIVEVTPEEYEQIKAKQLALPSGWSIEEELPRPADTDGGG
jgi:hypothetical protein